MREHFGHYYLPPAEEAERLFSAAIIALDANVLLHLYRYTSTTRRELLAVIERNRDRIWVPHQAASEFFANRLNVMQEQFTKIENARQSLSSAKGAFDQLYRAPVAIDPVQKKTADRAWARLTTYLESSRAEAVEPTSDVAKDPVLWELTRLLQGRVGDPYAPDRREEIEAEAEERFRRLVPPGFQDKDKREPNKYGDVILWFQLLDKAADTQRPLAVVTDDAKTDWWQRAGGKTIGPHPALAAELRAKSAQQLLMYNAARFMEYGRASRAAIEEAKDLPAAAAHRDDPNRRGSLFDARISLERDLSSLLAVERSLGAELADPSADTPALRSDLADVRMRILELMRELLRLDPIHNTVYLDSLVSSAGLPVDGLGFAYPGATGPAALDYAAGRYRGATGPAGLQYATGQYPSTAGRSSGVGNLAVPSERDRTEAPVPSRDQADQEADTGSPA